MQEFSNRLTVTFFALFLLGASNSAHAAARSEERASAGSSTLATLGFVARGFDYHEVANGRTYDSEKGMLPGFIFGLQQPLPAGFVAGGRLDTAFGKTNYDGATWAGTPVQTTTLNGIVDFEAHLGNDVLALLPRSTTHLVPYVGIGTHFWERETQGRGGYDEHYLFFYLPIGVQLREDFTRSIHLGLDASFRWNMGGHIGISNMPGYQDTGGSLGQAVGCRAELPFSFGIGEKVDFLVSPYFEYFGIGQGGAIPLQRYDTGADAGAAHEPDSHSFFYGLTLGMQIYL